MFAVVVCDFCYLDALIVDEKEKRVVVVDVKQ